MPRIRSVHPGLFTDEAFVALSDAAQVLFIGLWTEADDQGVFEWKPLTLRMRLRPAKDGPIEPLLSELEAANCIRQYEIGGRHLGAIRNFRKYQRPKSPNATHVMTDDIRIYVGLSGPISEMVRPKPAALPPKGERSPQMEEEGGRRSDGGGRMEGGGGVAAATSEADDEIAKRLAVGDRVLESAGIDPSKWTGSYAIVSAWLSAGYDPDLDILPAVHQVARRPGYTPDKPLNYFTKAIRDHHAQRTSDVSGGDHRGVNGHPQPLDVVDRIIAQLVPQGGKSAELAQRISTARKAGDKPALEALLAEARGIPGVAA